MANPIVEFFSGSGAVTNLLSAPSRLDSLPYAGTLTLEFSATENNGSRSFAMTIQPPEGELPMDNVKIPANGFSTTDNVLHNDTETIISFPDIPQGGHFNIDIASNGSGGAQWCVRATLTP